MSSALGTQEEIGSVLRRRLENGLKNISFFVVPSAVAFVVLGDVVVATIYRGGHFTGQDVTSYGVFSRVRAWASWRRPRAGFTLLRSMRCGIHARH